MLKRGIQNVEWRIFPGVTSSWKLGGGAGGARRRPADQQRQHGARSKRRHEAARRAGGGVARDAQGRRSNNGQGKERGTATDGNSVARGRGAATVHDGGDATARERVASKGGAWRAGKTAHGDLGSGGDGTGS